MSYVDGYVIPIQSKNLAAYKKMANRVGKVWMKNGALQYVECVADDLSSVSEWSGFPFPTMMKLKKGETAIFSYVVYTSRKHRDSVNKKVMNELNALPDKDKNICMPFDMKRMAYGGFKAIVKF